MLFLVDPPSASTGDVSRRLCVVVKLEVLGAVVVAVVVVVLVVVATAVVGVVTVVVVVSKEEGPGGRVTASAPQFTNNFPVAGGRENRRPISVHMHTRACPLAARSPARARTHARTHAHTRTHTHVRWQPDLPHAHARTHTHTHMHVR